MHINLVDWLTTLHFSLGLEPPYESNILKSIKVNAVMCDEPSSCLGRDANISKVCWVKHWFPSPKAVDTKHHPTETSPDWR